MTPETKTQITAWRDEIASELDQARNALSELQSSRETATTSARTATAAHRDLEQSLAAITDAPRGYASQTLAIPLTVRLQQHMEDLKTTQGKQIRAHGDAEVARRKVLELEKALSQVNQLLAPDNADAAA
jgi:hypothetical protein